MLGGADAAGVAGPTARVTGPSGDAERAVTASERDPAALRRLRRAVDRWTPRLDGLDPRRELAVIQSLGGRVVVPDSPQWPRGVEALGVHGPMCLWVRGELDLGRASQRSVALVGARACTEYGRRVAVELAEGLADRGFTVVSGGAYGIDAAAHRGALAAGGATVAVLAGGADRLYPAGNADLLSSISASGGAVLSEVPPGSVPSRVRFLLRNRLIAALTSATVVVEAAWRSGSSAPRRGRGTSCDRSARSLDR
ncbi:hypothetical protein GCM10025865_32380 [Paraoerskovia sediminicola]|uniref:Smf/DprA SLOG domain-containing protein n=1 Tax=Paraoerskovia sediminicola TaxID=1138587 RepID=A0ABM8G775_9CELL|nr:DNA-processing protein DprA [Paraoerskovia sediminicola]BDZ43939.1 hypothetical protein GCM10025865_32380 [Paraoerskovia sediminicola]